MAARLVEQALEIQSLGIAAVHGVGQEIDQVRFQQIVAVAGDRPRQSAWL